MHLFFIHLFIPSFILIYSLVYSFIQSLIHSLVHYYITLVTKRKVWRTSRVTCSSPLTIYSFSIVFELFFLNTGYCILYKLCVFCSLYSLFCKNCKSITRRTLFAPLRQQIMFEKHFVEIEFSSTPPPPAVEYNSLPTGSSCN